MADPDRRGLPGRPFLYTPDQLATLLSVSVSRILDTYLHYQNRSPGGCPPDKIRARDISPNHCPPVWRVDEKELVRWAKHKGIRF